MLTCNEFICHYSHCIQVRGSAGSPALKQFRWHVGECARLRVSGICLNMFVSDCQAEIQHFDMITIHDKDIGRLQITMDDVPLMQIAECLKHLQEHSKAFADREFATCG